MNGTTGAVNTGWGIGIEGGGNDTITQNTIDTVLYGIDSSNTWGAYGDDTIDGNNITNWDCTNSCRTAISINSDNNEITNNILVSSGSHSYGININGVKNTQVFGNTINLPNSDQQAIGIYSGSANTDIEQNKIIGIVPWGFAIQVFSGAVDTTIRSNDLDSCHSNRKVYFRPRNRNKHFHKSRL